MEWSQFPQGQHDPFTWFTKSQLQSVITDGLVPEWFHGIISRKTAEELLMPKPPGYFLIRVSESRVGYTLSYRDEGRCRHFMIDALDDGHYIILGENRRHRLLQDLVDFHRRTPIMPFTQVLTVACGQFSNDKCDYAELLHPPRPSGSNKTSQPDNSQLPSSNEDISQGNIPPALPFRPDNLMDSTVLTPNCQPNRLYPNLREEFQCINSPVPATPVPMIRKRYIGDNPASNQLPEVPARSCVPQKQNQVCIRTVSAPQSPSASTASEQGQCVNIQPLKNQETKVSVVTNLKNLKKKFQKKRSNSQDNAYAEVNMDTENEYQEISDEHDVSGSPLPHTCTDARTTDTVLPPEYLPPPPFAPGY
ncbi:hematopoietic SH2 domain-containing protein homolog [Mugil cephalus]|uniref:hematopoietic SH2 domain-containing protein homolog n=1 Tax=Mugil cephalus TaxID=48193 RepID=UPI001FB71FD8|nr:hematopoietic SH2 domain-containing protein homolog [Mugil cephalus]XP_047442326.1 hematopoietic SH2 domain-containing protein homolog [Mugil cephalus]